MSWLDSSQTWRAAFPKPSPKTFQRIEGLDAELRRVVAELAEVAKAHAARRPVDDAAVAARQERFESLQAEMQVALDEFQSEAGFSDEDLALLEAQQRSSGEDRTWWNDMVAGPTTVMMDNHLPAALEALERRVDPHWLRAEARKVLHLDPRMGLELVGGIQVDRRPEQPQRFAQILAVTRDHIERRNDLDIFSAAAVVPELLALGSRLHLVPELGKEAVEKLARLPELSFKDTSSTMFELHVGTALVAEGRAATMLRPDGAAKTPDFSVSDVAGIPFVVECKRRTGLTGYERREADVVNTLFAPVRAKLAREGIWVRIDVNFVEEVNRISSVDFENVVSRALARGHSAAPWGNVLAVELPKHADIEPTRLYSPDMLAVSFEWSFEHGEWDGIIADAEAEDCCIDRVSQPRCLRWRSRSANACLKKARGITSLFADAAKQVRAGEAGVIYIGYSEVGASHADARTRHTLETIEKREWHHERWRQIPLVLVSRFIAAPHGAGVPDLIESCLQLVETGWEPVTRYFPAPVVTRLA